MEKEIWMSREKQGNRSLYVLKTRSAELANRMLVADELFNVAMMEGALDCMSWQPGEATKLLVRHGWDPKGNFTAAEFVRAARNAVITKAKG